METLDRTSRYLLELLISYIRSTNIRGTWSLCSSGVYEFVNSTSFIPAIHAIFILVLKEHYLQWYMHSVEKDNQYLKAQGSLPNMYSHKKRKE